MEMPDLSSFEMGMFKRMSAGCAMSVRIPAVTMSPSVPEHLIPFGGLQRSDRQLLTVSHHCSWDPDSKMAHRVSGEEARWAPYRRPRFALPLEVSVQQLKWYRMVAVGALVVTGASHAQGPQPVIREIATVPGISVDYAVPLPNGRFLIYATNDSIISYELTSKRMTFLTRRFYSNLRVSPVGDRIAFARYAEDGENSFIASLPIDPETGQAKGPAQRVSISLGDEPSFSPDGNRLAFGSFRPKGAQDLVVVSVKGGPEKVLAQYPGRIGETYWSTDGKSVFAQVEHDQNHDRFTLEQVPSAGGRGETTMTFTGNAPMGSIQGRVLFTRSGVRNQAQREGRVEYVTASGSRGEFRIPRGANPGQYPEAARTLMIAYTRRDWAHIINLADGKVRELRPGSLSSRGPAWSPDGRKIALHDSTGGVYGITVINADGSGARHYPISALPSYMRWAPNGQTLAYAIEPRMGEPLQVGVLDLASGTTRVVSIAPNATQFDFRWRADGGSLLVMKWTMGSGPLVRQVFEAPVLGHERIVRDISSEFPELTRGGPISGDWVALGNASNTDHYLVPAAGGTPIKLPKGGYWIQEPGVSPDGKWLAALVRDPDGRVRSMEIVAADGSSVRPLRLPFEVGSTTFRPPFTPDGRSLILFGKAPGESVSKIYSVPLDGSAPKALATLPTTSTVAGRLDLSPDGSAVVFTSVGPWTSRIYEMDVTPILQAIKQ